MFEDNVLESRAQAPEEVESPQTVPAEGRAPNAKSLGREIEARAPLRQEEDPSEGSEWPAHPKKEQPQATSEKSRTRLLKRRPLVYAIGAMLLAAVLGGGYVYLDYAEHFQSTDDAFIAARQTEWPQRSPAISPPSPSPTTSTSPLAA
jgi:membrane fusion protein, multidrug efflux system